MNKKWGNIDPDFDNDNTINGWKLKVLDVEFFRLERPNMSSFDTDEIQTAINSSLALLDAECNGLIQEVWFITDVESKFYRTGKEKNYIREAAIMQTQYFINLGNDYTDGSTSFNASGISASFQRPLDKKNIAPGVFILLQKGRVYELQSYDLGGNNFGKKPTANSLVNYVQFGVGDVRYVSYNQMPYNRQEGSLLYVEKGEIKFFTVEQLDLTVPRAYLLWDKATKSFEDIHDVKDIAFFGNQLDNAITRQEAEELIAASPSGVSKEYVDDGLTLKQDKLTAGTGIDITGDVISATGGGGSGDVTLDTAQNITGIKTFTNGIKNNLVEVNGKSLIIKNSNTAASYLEVESVYSGSGYKNWFGIQLFRTTGTSRSRLANVEIRQDDGLYIDSVNDLSFTANNIKFGNARLQGVRTPHTDTDAATKKYVDDNVLLKQNKLTAGTNITIVGDTISSSGGTTNGVTLDTDQTITGRKTFTKAITINGGDGKKYFFDTNAGGGLNFSAPNYISNTVGGKRVIGFYDDGYIRCFNNRIIEVGTPTANTDAANKKYVDDNVLLKQNKLTAGTGIDITDDVISSSGGTTNGVTLDTDQIITGAKTFTRYCSFLRPLEVGEPTILNEATTKKYVDDNVLLKQNKLTAGTGIDITGDTISSTTVVSPDTALTSKTNTFDFRQIIKSGGSGLLDLQNSTGSVLNTTYDLASTSVKLTSPNTTSMTFTAKDFNFSDKEIKNVGTPITNKSAANKEYVDKADTLFKRATTSIASTTTAGDSTQTITSIFDAATWDLIKGSNAYYLLAYTSGRASRTGFPIVIKMEYAMTSDDYNVHTGAGDFTFFNYTDFATTYAIKVMVALSRENGSFRFAASFNGTLNANFNINRIEIWKKGTV